jgi:hypothetical protein
VAGEGPPVVVASDVLDPLAGAVTPPVAVVVWEGGVDVDDEFADGGGELSAVGVDAVELVELVEPDVVDVPEPLPLEAGIGCIHGAGAVLSPALQSN